MIELSRQSAADAPCIPHYVDSVFAHTAAAADEECGRLDRYDRGSPTSRFAGQIMLELAPEGVSRFVRLWRRGYACSAGPTTPARFR